MALNTAPVVSADGRSEPTATEKIISTVLRTGVFSSAALVVLGTIVTFIRHPDYVTSMEQQRQLKGGLISFPTSVPGILHGLAHFDGNAIVMGGLLILIATPVLRVAISIVAFLQMHDRVFAVITTIVLALLITSLSLGKAGG